MNKLLIKYAENEFETFKTLSGVDVDSFTVTNVLDETFDYGMFDVVSGNVKLAPKSRLTVENYEDDVLVATNNYVVTNVGKAQVRFIDGAELYDYQVTFAENSILLTYANCESIATTQPLPSVWEDNFTATNSNMKNGNGLETTTFGYTSTDTANNNTTYYYSMTVPSISIQSTYLANSSFVFPAFERYGRKVVGASTTVFYDDGDFYYIIKDSATETVKYEGYKSALSESGLVIDISGTYTITVHTENPSGESANKYSGRVMYKYTFIVYASVSKYEPLADKYFTLKEAAEKILDSDLAYYYNETRHFTLNEDLANSLNNVVAPDLYYTGNNLYQNLLLVSRIVNAIPRIKHDSWTEIVFDYLTASNSVPNGVLSNLNGNIEITDQDGFHGATVSNLENVVSSNKFALSTVVDTWRTVEVNPYERLTADAAFYKSTYPIYSVRSFKINYNGLGAKEIGQFLYESAIYSTMDKTSATSYNSILSALGYTQYENKIQGFNVGLQDQLVPTSPSAIAQIINRVYGVSITEDILANWYKNCLFQLEYVAVGAGRYKQFRPDAIKFGSGELAINQQVNVGAVETIGDSFRTSLMQLGNETISRTLFVKKGEELPKIGQSAVINGSKYVLTQMTTAFSSTGYDLALTFAKNFNRCNSVTSLETEKRWEDVSLRSAIRRNINIDEFCVVGDEIEYLNGYSNDKQLLFDNTLGFSYIFKPSNLDGLSESGMKTTFGTRSKLFRFKPIIGTDTSANAAYADNLFIGVTPDATDSLLVPALATSFGTSIVISSEMIDNYSAGTAKITSGGYQYCTSVPYSNTYGMFDNMQFQILDTEPNLTTAQANLLPYSTASVNSKPSTVLRGGILASTGTNVITVSKDSREAIRFVYSLNCISNNKNVIVSSLLCSLNPVLNGYEFFDRYGVYACLLKGYWSNLNTIVNDSDILHTYEEVAVNAVDVGLKPSVYQVYAQNDETISTYANNNKELCLAFVAEYNINRVDGSQITQKEIVVARNISLFNEGDYTPSDLPIVLSFTHSKDGIVYSE